VLEVSDETLGFTAAFRRQLAFTSLVLSTLDKPIDRLTEDDRVRLTKEYVLSMHREVDEILDNVPWKQHRFIGRANRDELLEELVDVQKFLFGLCHVWEVTQGELLRAFDRKSTLVEQRFYQDHVLPTLVASDKVVLIDVDDTVADWSGGFEQWVKRVEPELIPNDYAKHVDPGLRERLKSRCHSDGGITTLPVFEHSRKAVNALQRAGYKVVWLSARPVHRHPRLAVDTVNWLTDAGFPHEYIFYSTLNKHSFVVEKFPRAVALFDDDAEIVAHAKEFGIPAFRVEVKQGGLLEQVRLFLSLAKEEA